MPAGLDVKISFKKLKCPINIFLSLKDVLKGVVKAAKGKKIHLICVNNIF